MVYGSYVVANKLLPNPETFFLSLLVKGTPGVQSGMDTQGFTFGVDAFQGAIKVEMGWGNSAAASLPTANRD